MPLSRLPRVLKLLGPALPPPPGPAPSGPAPPGASWSGCPAALPSGPATAWWVAAQWALPAACRATCGIPAFPRRLAGAACADVAPCGVPAAPFRTRCFRCYDARPSAAAPASARPARPVGTLQSLSRDGRSLVSRQTGLYRSIEDESLSPLAHLQEALRLRFDDAASSQPIPAYNRQVIEAYTTVSIPDAQRARQ